MREWFDESDTPARPAFGEHSPKCQDGRHFQCSGWWWVTKDKIAVTCQCACHAPGRADVDHAAGGEGGWVGHRANLRLSSGSRSSNGAAGSPTVPLPCCGTVGR